MLDFHVHISDRHVNQTAQRNGSSTEINQTIERQRVHNAAMFSGNFLHNKPKQDRGSLGFMKGGAVDEKCRSAVLMPPP